MMKDTLVKIISSGLATIVLLLIYISGLALATIIEKYYGTPSAKAWIYYSPLFFILQVLLVINFVAAVVRYQLLKKRKWGFIFVHFAFIVILLGALTSHVFGEEGVLHLREGESSNIITVQSSGGMREKTLPFTMQLIKFKIERYPGSNSPSSYESKVKVDEGGQISEHRIFMNNVLDIKGYRFFQASFDPDEQGTVLSVNSDVAGRNITYAGYALLCLGLIFILTGRNSRFRSLARQLKEMRMTLIAVSAALLSVFTYADVGAEPSTMRDAALKQYVIPESHAERFGALPLQSYNGRMMPVNTFASEVLRKLHKSRTFDNLSPDQFLLSLLAMPDIWAHVPLIVLPGKELSTAFGLPPKEIAYADVFDENDNYKLQAALEEAYHKSPAVRTRFDKDLIKLDEQVNILHQLLSLQLLNIFPLEGDADRQWYAPGDDLSVFTGKDSAFVSKIFYWYLDEIQAALKSNNWKQADDVLGMISAYQKAKSGAAIDPKRIETELKYNRMDIFRSCKTAYLLLGATMLVVAFVLLFRKSKWLVRLTIALICGVCITFLFHTLGLGMRWFIAGRAPWANSYETMVYVSWATICGGMFFVRKSSMTMGLATLFGGVILFVSGLNWMDPQINPLVPVLKSPWLMFHVAVIVAAYGFFGISCLLGLTNLTLHKIHTKNREQINTRIKELTIINEMSLTIGLVLMTAGTFLGAVWANESWGRYWGWDPKETWALITMISYAVILHLRLVKKWNKPQIFNLLSALAFLTVMMTFFGVNYFLTGMHSYGG